MGCVSSSEPEADDMNEELELKIVQDRIESLYSFKILLLGAGESGKSTVLKQLKNIHNVKANQNELTSIIDSLHQNVIDCMRSLILACETFEYELEDDRDKQTARELEDFEDGKIRITPEFGDNITRLYNSAPIKQAYKRRSEFWLLDSCSYYMDNLDRFTREGFTPSEEDQLRSRIRTTGIVLTDLESKLAQPQEGEPRFLKFQVVDVGGQKNERKKWIHCFDDVKAILFIVNLAGYNQVLFEDSKKNRLEESVDLFKDITNNPTFKETPIFLFLNKKDLFETMIQETDLSVCYPEYKGGKDVQAAIKYVSEIFMKQLPAGKTVETEPVTSVWKRDIKCAFENVKTALLSKNRPMIDTERVKFLKDKKKLEGKKAGKQKLMEKQQQQQAAQGGSATASSPR